MDKMTENDLGYQIRGACFKVYNELGPGLLESAYEAALALELGSLGLSVETQVPINVLYRGLELGTSYRIDILVEGKVLIELKSVEKLSDLHHKQLLTYLKLANIKLGYLVNFNTDSMKDSIIRHVNNL
ncbi:MAG TPA: GxxExxY protein [Candidatus Syntrophosphaera sp.]|nr:GxxExxY protein [Candidatus Syntrophosphaera sp.]